MCIFKIFSCYILTLIIIDILFYNRNLFYSRNLLLFICLVFTFLYFCPFPLLPTYQTLTLCPVLILLPLFHIPIGFRPWKKDWADTVPLVWLCECACAGHVFWARQCVSFLRCCHLPEWGWFTATFALSASSQLPEWKGTQAMWSVAKLAPLRCRVPKWCG